MINTDCIIPEKVFKSGVSFPSRWLPECQDDVLFLILNDSVRLMTLCLRLQNKDGIYIHLDNEVFQVTCSIPNMLQFLY